MQALLLARSGGAAMATRLAGRLRQHAFWLALAFSAVICALLVIVNFSHGTGVQPAGLAAELRHGLDCVIVRVNPAWAPPCASPPPATLDSISNKIHPLPGLGSGILQILGVVGISAMWVFASLSHRRTHFALAGIVTLAYVYGMFNAYQPAVLVAALIAILAAAEHLGTLSQQTAELEKQLDMLGKAGASINAAIQLAESQAASLAALSATMSAQGKALKEVTEDVARISNTTQLRLSAEGIQIFRQEMFNAYTRAKTIYAVVREHGVDRVWWELALAMDIGQRGLATVWSRFYEVIETRTDFNLYRALTGPRAPLRDGLPPPQQPPGIESAYFVSDMPMPHTLGWEAEDPGQLFNAMLGLAWDCIVLDKVRRELGIRDAIGIWISRPLCWAHATEYEVFQVVRHGRLEDSIVLKTANLIASDRNTLDEKMSMKTIESTQAEIRRYLQRGVPAEEYLCAVLCYAAVDYEQSVLHEDPCLHLHDLELAACLNRIHMDKWLSQLDSLQADKSQALAVAIFKEFIDLCWRRSAAGLDAQIDAPVHRSMGLAREIS